MALQTSDGWQLAREIWRPAVPSRAFPNGEGPRVGVLGDSRCGKTNAMRALIASYLETSRGVVLVVDDKEPQPQFAGCCRRNVADLEKRPINDNDGRVVVFRGSHDDLRTGAVDPEEIARMQWRMAMRRFPSLGVYDELDKACNNGQWRAGEKDSYIFWAFRRGGGLGAASMWGTQETESIPAAAFNQSSIVLCFRMTGNPLRLLKRRGYLDGGVEKIIPRLPGDELPPAQRGYFVALRRGRPWDGKVYRFAARPPTGNEFVQRRAA